MRVSSSKAQSIVSTKRRNDTLAPDMIVPQSKKNRVVTSDSVVELLSFCVLNRRRSEKIINESLFTKREKEVVILF